MRKDIKCSICETEVSGEAKTITKFPLGNKPKERYGCLIDDNGREIAKLVHYPSEFRYKWECVTCE